MGRFREVMGTFPEIKTNSDYLLVCTAMEKVQFLYKSVASSILPPDWKRGVVEFTQAWEAMAEKLDISTPPKVHIIKQHLITYIELTGNFES